MPDDPMLRFASEPAVVFLAVACRHAGLDALIVGRGRIPGAAVQVLGLSVESTDDLRSLLQAALQALDDGYATRRFDPTAGTG